MGTGRETISWPSFFARAIAILSITATLVAGALGAASVGAGGAVVRMSVQQPTGPAVTEAREPRRAPARSSRRPAVQRTQRSRAAVRRAHPRRAQVRRLRARRRARIARARRNTWGWPVRGRITSRFGWRRSPVTHRVEYHSGTDIACPRGVTVRASRPGRVLLAGHLPIYGHTVVLRHRGGWVTFTAHMASLKVRAGEWVRPAQPIGRCGSTGRATGPHVHLEIRPPSGRNVDALPRLWHGNRVRARARR